MLREFILLSLICTVLCSVIAPKESSVDGRVVGGTVADIRQFPYQVSVRLLNTATCGGSILNEFWILTAAHCLRTYLSPSLYSVQYGLTEIGSMENVINAAMTLNHENYNSATEDYDIALMRLETAIPLGANARPIAIAPYTPAPGTNAVVTGWGWVQENGPSSTILQQVGLQIMDPAVCTYQYSNVRDITERMICAGVVGGGKDACRGDSGGPLVANGVQVGVVSWGVGCARSEYAGVSTNIALVRDWITKHVSNFL